MEPLIVAWLSFTTVGALVSWACPAHPVGWIAAGIAVGAAAFFVEPVYSLVGVPLDGSADGTASGTVPFVLSLGMLGVVGGAVGGVIEGLALRHRVDQR